VLIVGAGGLFGSRLARLLARRQGYRLSLGGRDEANVAALQAELVALDPEGIFKFVALDRRNVKADRLLLLGSDLVADCAGPFHDSGTVLIEACIVAGCHYVDLADSRAFVAGIERFDAAARAAGVAVVSGASSTPGLTHAVVDALAPGWTSIDSVDVAIVPGNRTPKGRSVILSILTWVGQKVAVFREAGWQSGRGWGDRRWVKIEGLGRRRASLADVPDLDLLVGRYAPRVRASFTAGMELPILHWLIGLCGRAVRLRLVRSATAFAGIGHWVAQRLDGYGTDKGGMLVEVAGTDETGESKFARWSLCAVEGDGPYVPAIPAAAAIEGLLSGRDIFRGARPAAGFLRLDEIKPWFEGLAITVSGSSFRREKPLYRRVMGAGFDLLPEVTRRVHRGRPAIVATGEAVVIGAENPLGGMIARLFGLPKDSPRVPVRVVIEAREGREHWTRFFDGKPMRSVMSQGRKNGVIEERFGAFTFGMRLVARAEGLDMVRVSGRIGRLPLPAFLLPRIKAEERADGDGRHAFYVEIKLPLIGRLAAYRGWLEV
jgi:hypothetical protein